MTVSITIDWNVRPASDWGGSPRSPVKVARYSKAGSATPQELAPRRLRFDTGNWLSELKIKQERCAVNMVHERAVTLAVGAGPP